MDNKNNCETQVKSLTDVCQTVCTFIKSMSVENMSKDKQINIFKNKVNDLQRLYSDLETQLKQINKNIKIVASLQNFTINENDSTIDILTQWINSLSHKNVGHTNKRKLLPSYSPLKLSLKNKSEIDESTKNKPNCTKLEKENRISLENKSNNVWKLSIKVDGNPSDLLKKSKQTTLNVLPQKNEKMDITTFNNSSHKTAVSNSNTIRPEILSANKIDVDTNNYTDTQIDEDDSGNISLSHFNKIINPCKNVLPVIKTNFLKPNTFQSQHEKHDQSFDETIYNPTHISMTVLKKNIVSNHQTKIRSKNLLDTFDTILGLNDKQNNLPNYNFKEDPVRKRNERKLLNGWDCEDCCKFYEANNDNPVEAKKAMNHFSRHRSVKHQHHAPTPPGFWDPT